jgi:hypothetical protein
MGDDALTALESFRYAVEHLARMQGAEDRSKTKSAETYHEIRKQEGCIQIALILGAVLLFQNALSSEDVKQLQKFIELRMIKLLEHRLSFVKEAHESKPIYEKIASYKQLIKAVEINYE